MRDIIFAKGKLLVKVLVAVPTLGVGGAEIMVETLVSKMIEYNEVVLVVYCFVNSPIEDRLRKLGIRIVCLNKPKGFSAVTLRKIRKIVRKERPEIIHTNLHILPYFWVAGGKVPIVHTVHTVADKEQSGLGKVIYRYIYQHSRRITPVAITEQVRESLIEEYGKKLKDIPLIINGVNFSGYYPKTDYDVKATFEILHIGRVCSVKNHSLIIDCIKTLFEDGMDIHLTFVGDGPDKELMEEKMVNLKLQRCITFAGLQKSTMQFMKDADLLILPSSYEGMPMSLIEAMGMGLPIIASNVGGIPDMIENEKEGLLINPTYFDLCDSIRNLYCDRRKREYLGKNALEKSLNFSQENMVEMYNKLYHIKAEKC